VPAMTAAARVPLKDAIASIEPQDVWQNFRSDADSAAFASF
jgi:hypothetical protein